jgi:ribose transport system permease protein
MSDAPMTADARAPRRRRLDLPDLGNRFGLLAAWAAVIVAFSVARPETFATAENFQAIFGSQAVLLIVTMGLLVALTAGEFDLSIAGVLNMSLVLVGFLNVEQGWPIWLAVLAALTAGVLIGLFNAFFVIVVGIESIVVTLGSGTLLLGLSLGIKNLAIPGISDGLIDVVRTELFGIQLGFWYGLLLTALVWYVFRYTPLGRYLFFVGAGRDVARLAGIRVDRIRVGALVASSGAAALAGVMLAGLLGASDPNAGSAYLLPAFAGAFLGSTAITPGRFNPWGSFIAVYFLVTGITGLQLMGLSGWIEQVFYGGSLVLAVTFSRLAAKRRRVDTSTT